jgi:hypothetical protein
MMIEMPDSANNTMEGELTTFNKAATKTVNEEMSTEIGEYTCQ